MTECLVYNAKEVATMLGCSLTSAYNRIKGMNLDYAQKNKMSVKNFLSGKISKEVFHEYYPNIKCN